MNLAPPSRLLLPVLRPAATAAAAAATAAATAATSAAAAAAPMLRCTGRYFSSKGELPTPLYTHHRIKPQKKQFIPTIKEGKYAVLPAQEIPDGLLRPAYAAAADGRPQPPAAAAAAAAAAAPAAAAAAANKYIYNDPTDWSIDYKGEIQEEKSIKKIKIVSSFAAAALRLAAALAKPGVTTEEIDKKVHLYLINKGVYPAAINFFGFPKALCTSVNEVACHGIPDLRPLEEGDIVSFDCTAFYDGFFGDCAGTFAVGSIAPQHAELIAAAKECLAVAIKAVKPGRPIGEVGKVIQEFSSSVGLSVISSFCGHFIGRRLHLPPLVPHSYPNDATEVFRVGQTFTIEPILTEGSGDIRCWSDGWTIVTQDNGRCAQFEHTLLVTEEGAVPLTVVDD